MFHEFKKSERASNKIAIKNELFPTILAFQHEVERSSTKLRDEKKSFQWFDALIDIFPIKFNFLIYQ